AGGLTCGGVLPRRPPCDGGRALDAARRLHELEELVDRLEIARVRPSKVVLVGRSDEHDLGLRMVAKARLRLEELVERIAVVRKLLNRGLPILPVERSRKSVMCGVLPPPRRRVAAEL